MEGDVKMATVRLAGIVSSISGVQVASRFDWLFSIPGQRVPGVIGLKKSG